MFTLGGTLANSESDTNNNNNNPVISQFVYSHYGAHTFFSFSSIFMDKLNYFHFFSNFWGSASARAVAELLNLNQIN